MKKLLTAFFTCAFAIAAYSQGQVNFNNRVANPSGGFFVDAKVFGTDGLALQGNNFSVMLYGGAQGTAAGSLQASGVALNFRTGTGAGYINATGFDTTRFITGVPVGGTATLQVRAWDNTTGSTWETATVRGASATFDVVTGGAGSPPSLPANLVGLQSFQLVPEPSTFALGALGIGALLMVRRRKV